METTIGPYRIRYEWEIEMNPDTLCETDRRYIKQEVEDLGSVGGDLYIGDEVVGHWELIETEYKQKEEEQL